MKSGDASAGYHWKTSSGSGQGSQRTGRGNSEAVRRKRTIAEQRSRSDGMGKSSQPAQSDCGRDYSQGIDLCLNEGDEVVDCDLIIVCEHESFSALKWQSCFFGAKEWDFGVEIISKYAIM